MKRSQCKRTEVVRDLLALVFYAGHEARIEEGSRLRVGWKLAVNLRVLGQLGLLECGCAVCTSRRHKGVDGVSVSRCRWGGVVGDVWR